MNKKNLKEEKIIKETEYCKIINQGKVGEGEYTYSIEKVYIKEVKRNEIMKRILCVGVIRNGKMAIKPCDEKEIRRNV